MPKARPLPSLGYLRECFELDIATGRLTWRVRPTYHFAKTRFRSAQSTANNWNTIWGGREALTNNERGYRRGKLGDQFVYAHRIIWKMVHGHDAEVIDHIDGDRGNNRPENLRAISHAENCRNQRLHAHNRSGVTGVSWDKQSGRWRAEHPGRRRDKHLGYFDDLPSAAAARKAAEAAAGYHPNHGRGPR